MSSFGAYFVSVHLVSFTYSLGADPGPTASRSLLSPGPLLGPRHGTCYTNTKSSSDPPHACPVRAGLVPSLAPGRVPGT